MDNRPLSPWEYFGLQILYNIPIVGFIFLLIHTFSSGNINRRNFARSYWCIYAIALILMIIFAVSGTAAAFWGFLAGLR